MKKTLFKNDFCSHLQGCFIVESELSALIQVIEILLSLNGIIYLYNQICLPESFQYTTPNTWCPRLYAGSKCFILFLFFMLNDMVIVVLMLIYQLTSQLFRNIHKQIGVCSIHVHLVVQQRSSFDSNQYTYLNENRPHLTRFYFPLYFNVFSYNKSDLFSPIMSQKNVVFL